MKRDLAALAAREYDLLIVGGGILGAGICWDASLRGFSCALVERSDFAGGTSSKTSKLIHGGIRYLENLDFRLVRESLRERGTLLRIAPDLVRPLPFLIPVAGRYPRPWWVVRLGVALYGWMARPREPGTAVLAGEKLEREEPFLKGTRFRRAAGYSDAQMEDAGLVLRVIQAAAQAGAQVANHAPVEGWLMENGKVAGAEVADRLTGKRYAVRARVVMNATGPWVDKLRRIADPSARPLVRPSKGIHLLYPDLGLRHALIVSSRSDGRIFFLIPWRGMTLIGTTDTDYAGDPAQAQAVPADVDYLIREAGAALPQAGLSRRKVIATFAGVRPLVLQEKKDPWAVSRMHLIHEDKNGLVSIVGGKFTTFRKIAEEAVEAAAPRFPTCIPSSRTERSSLAADPAKRKAIDAWTGSDTALKAAVCPHHRATWAEARYAVEEEMARSLSDLFWRRLPLALSPCHGLDAAEEASRRMAGWLGWDETERQLQLDSYRKECETASYMPTSLQK